MVLVRKELSYKFKYILCNAIDYEYIVMID